MSPIVMAATMYVLYEVSIVLIQLNGKKLARVSPRSKAVGGISAAPGSWPAQPVEPIPPGLGRAVPVRYASAVWDDYGKA